MERKNYSFKIRYLPIPPSLTEKCFDSRCLLMWVLFLLRNKERFFAYLTSVSFYVFTLSCVVDLNSNCEEWLVKGSFTVFFPC